MSSSSLKDARYQMDILKKVLSEDMAFLKSLEDPLEACLISISEGEDVGCPIDERDIYTKLLNLAPSMSRTFTNRILPPRMIKGVPLK